MYVWMIIWSWIRRRLGQESKGNCSDTQDMYEVEWFLQEVLSYSGDTHSVKNNGVVLLRHNVTSNPQSLLRNWHLLDFASIESPTQEKLASNNLQMF